MTLDETISGGQAGHTTDHEALHTRYNETFAYGELWISTAAATTITSPGTYYKAAGTTTLETTPAAVDFTMPVDNRLTYGGTDTRTFWVSCTFSAKTSGTNQLVGFRLAEGGVSAAKTEVRRLVGTGTDEGAGAVHGLFQLATNEYIELFVTNETSSNTVTVEHGNLTVVAVN